jgi:radical SAM enzyme (TIGR01210 family)
MNREMSFRDQIVRMRGERLPVDPRKANGVWVEAEADGCGGQVKVLTVLLAVSECPWRCAMCDLWQQTLDRPTAVGDVPKQMESALHGLTNDVRWIKLYNSGNFFDAKSIPTADHERIAELCHPFERVIVENHPRLCTDRVLSFSRRLAGQLEVALGVETLQTGMLRRLNKGMNRDDIDGAIHRLRSWQIDVRAFLLLRPPWTLEQEAIRWTELSLRHLFRLGVRHASIIPVRAGNGWLQELHSKGEFTPPSTRALETIMNRAMMIPGRGVVTADLWNWPPVDTCSHCAELRKQRLDEINRHQRWQENYSCDYCGQHEDL